MKKPFTKNSGYSEQNLLHAAIDHLAAAKYLFEKHHRFFDSAGYLSHLGIELFLKSVLIYHTAKFPKEHSLIELYNQLERQGIDITLNNDQIKILSELDKFFNLRYPQPNKPIEIGEEDWNTIKKLFYVLLNQMPREFQQYLNNVNHKEKSGRILMRKKKQEHIE